MPSVIKWPLRTGSPQPSHTSPSPGPPKSIGMLWSGRWPFCSFCRIRRRTSSSSIFLSPSGCAIRARRPLTRLRFVWSRGTGLARSTIGQGPSQDPERFSAPSTGPYQNGRARGRARERSENAATEETKCRSDTRQLLHECEGYKAGSRVSRYWWARHKDVIAERFPRNVIAPARVLAPSGVVQGGHFPRDHAPAASRDGEARGISLRRTRYESTGLIARTH